jgi:hypothetical protein
MPLFSRRDFLFRTATLATGTALFGGLAFAENANAAAGRAPAGWTPLLDANLSQWEPFLGAPRKGVSVPGYNDPAGRKPIGKRDPLGVFTARVVDGEPVLRVSGEIIGGLTSLRVFSDYRLRFQFRFLEKRWPPRENKPRDNGILYHCVGAHGAFGGAWMRSVEFQIQENDVGDFWPLCGSMADFPARAEADAKGNKLWRYTPGAPLVARGARVLRGTNYAERPLGEWNDAELVVTGGNSKHILNGRVVNELRDIRYAEGRGAARREIRLSAGKIQIQSEFAEVEFRRMFIAPATEPLALEPAAAAPAAPATTSTAPAAAADAKPAAKP